MNIKMVAKHAGVSTATVSRTMNGSAHVHPATAERVRLAIAAMQFYPNTHARSLGSGKSGLYGLIVSDITNPFFPGLVKAFESFAIEHGREVLIANTDYDVERMHHCVSRFLQRKVDGVAILTSEMDDHSLEAFSRRSIPLVFLDTEYKGARVHCVKIDYVAGTELAIKHLVDLGHRRIGFISGPMRLRSAVVRYEAFREISARRRLETHPALIQEGNHRVDGGHEAMLRILNAGERPTAILASNDLTAIGAMSAIASFGLRVPQDISVVGIDDIQFSAFTSPPLTTVRLPYVEIARAAFQALHQNEGGAKALRTKVHVTKPQSIAPLLIVRQSTTAIAEPQAATARYRRPRKQDGADGRDTSQLGSFAAAVSSKCTVLEPSRGCFAVSVTVPACWPARTHTAPVPPIRENGLSPINSAGPSSAKTIGSSA